MADKTPKNKNNTKKSALQEAVSSAVPSGNKKQQNKTNSTQELVKYLKENFPLITSLISDFKNNSEKNNKQQTQKLTNLEKHSVKNNNQTAQIQTNLQDSKKLLSTIVEKLHEANDQRRQAAELEEERIAEDKKEKAIIEEKRAEEQQKQNAQIITKLTDLGDSLNGIDGSSGGGGGGSGLMGLLGSLLKFVPMLLSSVLPMIMTGLGAIGGSIATLFGTLLPFILPIITAALAGAAGYAIFKTWIEPWMEEREAKIKQALSSVIGGAQIKSEQVTTDTGEKVFSREDAKTGEISYVSESQMKTELASMSEEDRKKVQSGEGPVSYSAATNVVDVHSGMYTNLNPIESGKTIEQINQIAKEAAKSRATMPENLQAQGQYAKEIVNFDESFRSRLAETMTAWAREGEHKGFGLDQGLGIKSTFGVATGREMFKPVLESLFNEHMSLIKRIRDDKRLKPEDREALIKISPLFESSFGIADPAEGSDPDYDTLWLLGYDLPSGQGLTFDWGNSSATLEENRAIIDKEFGAPSGRAEALKEKYKAKAETEKSGTATPSEGLATPPQAAEGAVVYPKTGKGVLTNISEDMKPEAVVPLDKYVISEKGTLGVEPINLSEKATMAMRNTYFEEKDAQRETQAPVVINNVNNMNQSGGGSDGANFQFQTDLAKTFDNVFEMILEKNIRMGMA